MALLKPGRKWAIMEGVKSAKIKIID